MSLVYPDGRHIAAEGYLYGDIIENPRGNGGFGYDPLFVIKGESRTVAEMSEEEKNAVSHRRRALDGILEKL